MDWLITNFVPIVLCTMFAIPTLLPLSISVFQEKNIDTDVAEEVVIKKEETPDTPMSLCLLGVWTMLLVALLVLVSIFGKEILRWIMENGIAFPLG